MNKLNRKNKVTRAGIKDMYNAYLLDGAKWNKNENQYCFNTGFKHLLKTKHPHTLVVVGSTNYPCFEEAKKQGVRIVQFDGDTRKYFKERKGKKNE